MEQRRKIDSRLSGVARRMQGLSLHLTQAAKSSDGKRYLEFIVLRRFKMKIGWLDNVNLEQEMKNLACGDHWILPVVACPVLRRVENEEISYWQMVSCVSWPCFQERSGGDYGVLESLTDSYRTWTHNRLAHKRTPNQFGSQATLAKWLSIRLRTMRLWVRAPLLSLKLQISHLFRTRGSLTFRQL